jgi:hypothetical protein
MLGERGTSYILLEESEYNYMNGSQTHDFAISVSSMPVTTIPDSIQVYISFAELRLTVTK